MCPLRGSILVPIHRAGWPFIGIFAAVALGLGLAWEPLGWLGAALTLWCIAFFRDPPRATPVREGLIVSAADGVVQRVDRAPAPAELGMGDAIRDRVAVFMSPFDVHINRAPCDGIVSAQAYRPGKFLNASLDKASEFNERHSLRITMADGRDLACVQIAGFIARRILCWARDGQSVQAGERYGMIRFGSRVDHYLPEGVAPLVAEGQRTVAGETVIADLRTQEPARTAAVRGEVTP